MFYIKFNGEYDFTKPICEIVNDKKISKETMLDIIDSCIPIEIKTEGVLIKELSKLDSSKKKLLAEDFVPKTITNINLEKVFKKFFDDTQIGNDEVTIADQYIFSNGVNIQLLSKIIVDNVKSKKVRFVYNKGKNDNQIYNSIIDNLKNNGFQINLVSKQNLHDRYWYSKTGGFLVCASFNTLQKSPTIIKKLDFQELCQIYKYYGVQIL